MFEIELAFSPRDYEQDIHSQARACADAAQSRRRAGIRFFKTSFGAAFALATAAFWFTMATDPPKAEASSPRLPMGDQIIDPPGRDAHCKNFLSTCPEEGRKWGGKVGQGRT
jgi:hypothetical protein